MSNIDLSAIFPHSEPVNEKYMVPIMLILKKDKKALLNFRHGKSFPYRMMISLFKNMHDHLEFLLDFMNTKRVDPEAGSYFYTDLTDHKRTIDLYHRYGISAFNIDSDTVPIEQWNYMLKIGYVDKEPESSDDEDEDDEDDTVPCAECGDPTGFSKVANMASRGDTYCSIACAQ
jgi:hypothetical protein